MIAHVLILGAVIGAATGVAVLIHKRRQARWGAAPEYSAALGFVGSAYGLLLGLLVVNAVGHFSDVRNQAQAEASSLASLYDVVGIYPAATSAPVRHNLICYMRSIADDEWPSMARGNQLEVPPTIRSGDRLRDQLASLPLEGPRDSSTYSRAVSLIGQADDARQRLLFLAAPGIPTALWVVIYVGAFVVFMLLSVHYAAHPSGRLWALSAIGLLMIVVIAVLSMLDEPYGFGVSVQPRQIDQAIHLLLTGEKNPTILSPCR